MGLAEPQALLVHGTHFCLFLYAEPQASQIDHGNVNPQTTEINTMSYSNLFTTISDYSDYSEYSHVVCNIKDALNEAATSAIAESRAEKSITKRDTLHQVWKEANAKALIGIEACMQAKECHALCVKAQSLLPLYVAAIESLSGSTSGATFKSASADIIKAATSAPVLSAPTPAPKPSRVEPAQVLATAIASSRVASAQILAKAIADSRAATAAIIAKYSV